MLVFQRESDSLSCEWPSAAFFRFSAISFRDPPVLRLSAIHLRDPPSEDDDECVVVVVVVVLRLSAMHLRDPPSEDDDECVVVVVVVWSTDDGQTSFSFLFFKDELLLRR